MVRRSPLLAVVLLLLAAVPAVAQTVQPRKTINTDDADFTVISAPAAGTNLRIGHLDLKNEGSGAVTVQLCDGTCATSGNVVYEWTLAAGGGWTFNACRPEIEWALTAGRALIARVDTGATNNVRVTTIYRKYPF